MKDGHRIIDCDLHVIEDGELFENYLDPRFHDHMPDYLGWGPTNFPHWDVKGQTIPPWARDDAVVGPTIHFSGFCVKHDTTSRAPGAVLIDLVSQG